MKRSLSKIFATDTDLVIQKVNDSFTHPSNGDFEIVATKNGCVLIKFDSKDTYQVYEQRKHRIGRLTDDFYFFDHAKDIKGLQDAISYFNTRCDNSMLVPIVERIKMIKNANLQKLVYSFYLQTLATMKHFGILACRATANNSLLCNMSVVELVQFAKKNKKMLQVYCNQLITSAGFNHPNQ